MRRPWRLVAIVLFTAALFAGGLFGGRVLAVSDETSEVLRLYTELVAVAHDRYAEEVSYKELVDASIDGMVRTLDPHTSFLSADAFADMRGRQQRTFSGLGILVGMRNGQLTVITPIEGTPASRMGMRAGDVIFTIEGESTDGMDIDEAVRRLKGPTGTAVTIEIVRRSLLDPLEMTITREEIPQTTVRYTHMLTPEVGYFAVFDFNRGTADEVQQAIAELRDQGMSSLLVDLRRNGGGLLDQAIEVAEQFVPTGGKIVETRGRTRDSFQDFTATDSRGSLDLPVIVLVSHGTASAAEILAGAIQDHDVGLIVGEPTWGKGLVQTVYSLSYGNGLSVTTAKYYTPSGRLIQRDYTSWFDYATYSNGASAEGTAAVEEDRQVFYTDLGRQVFGGGGIAPDVLVAAEELPTFAQHLLSRNAFFDFAVDVVDELAVEGRDWRPGPELLATFSEWLVDNELAAEEELAEGLSGEEEREMVRRYLHAELFNAAFGIDARYQVLTRGDSQIQRALELFPRATELLAQRQSLRGEGTAPAALGTGLN